jgi:hypothetical protein
MSRMENEGQGLRLPGKCEFCGAETSKLRMNKHLLACPSLPAGKSPRGTVFRLVVEGKYSPEYWLMMDASGASTIRALDEFLRGIWLECCGHLSCFSIDDVDYLSRVSKEPALWPFAPRRRERDMDILVGRVLRPRLRFFHEYDFGTPTRLVLKVILAKEDVFPRGEVRLLARNTPPNFRCAICGAQATRICGNEICEPTFLCSGCPKRRDEEDCLPIVNSPRMGVCGYTGPYCP